MNRSIKYSLLPATLFAAVAFAPLAAQGTQPPKYKRDLPPELLKQATVSEADAARTAAAKIANGRIQAVELENEDGLLLYSYDLKVPGKSGIEEVNVNAKTGEVVRTEHENASAEKKEARNEKAKHPRGEKPDQGAETSEPGEGAVN